MNFIKHPYLQLPESDGITVMWETDMLSTSQLLIWEASCPECGTVKYSPQGTPLVFYGEDGYIHKVTASGLDSGKDYCYQVSSATADMTLSGEISVLRTKFLKDGIFSFALTSETGGSGSPVSDIERLAKAISGERPDFLLFVGDMVDDGRRKQDWDNFMFTPFRSLLSNTPFYHCAGNHEEHSDYMKEFLATSEKGYYDFNYGCAHFVALDSTQLADYTEDEDGRYINMKLTQELTLDNPQLQFLSDSLKNSNAKWKFVYMHYSPYVSATWEGKILRPLCKIFEKYDVDIVFTSHTIVYERSHPIRNNSFDSKGVRYIVVGGAGARPDWFHHKKSWHTAKSRAVSHFVHISISPEYLEFQAIDLDGRLFDSFILQK